MKLYLASLPIIHAAALRELIEPRRAQNALIIANAWDVYPQERREPIINQHLQAVSDFGLTPRLIDLKTTQAAQLADLLRQQALVWVMGGNSFYLNYYLHQSGFSQVIQAELKEGLVYAGDSAGAAVAGPTIHGVEHLDDPAAAPEVMWDGLGLTDFGIVPHWGNPKFAAALTQCRDEMAGHQPVRVISDTEVLIVHGDKIEIMPVRDEPSPT